MYLILNSNFTVINNKTELEIIITDNSGETKIHKSACTKAEFAELHQSMLQLFAKAKYLVAYNADKIMRDINAEFKRVGLFNLDIPVFCIMKIHADCFNNGRWCRLSDISKRLNVKYNLDFNSIVFEIWSKILPVAINKINIGVSRD